MAADLRFEVTDKPSVNDVEAIEHGLYEHIRETTGYGRVACAILVRDAAGKLVAGLSGSALAARFYIALLWVAAERRGEGLGRVLMSKAEKEALRLGCERIHVDTAGFQAPAFYTKLGYRTVATVKDYIKGYDRIFFEKSVP